MTELLLLFTFLFSDYFSNLECNVSSLKKSNS